MRVRRSESRPTSTRRRPPWNNITVRHLLTHTSGVSDEGFGELNLRLDYTDSELVHRDCVRADCL